MFPTLVSMVFGTKNSLLDGIEDPETMETVEIGEAVILLALILVTEVSFELDAIGCSFVKLLTAVPIASLLSFPIEPLIIVSSVVDFWDPAVEVFPVIELF